ncbi:unnamed protein product [Spirodela intermedia]|uniref:Kinesin motor domain-containing protein n=1 Tax=Spirodela intermedia TaxID=51605 RepID=A0A7I8JBA7_SPIIN|nr:unnamed protein product [Spirodela intermedia]CAA6667488.1 unnamed protein product [Spirodela intermedia]
MLRDLKFFRRNSGKTTPADGNDENVAPTDGSTVHPGTSFSRVPFNAIQEALANHTPDPDQETTHKRKIEKTPSKACNIGSHAPASKGNHVVSHDASYLRTPEKPPVAVTPAGTARNRFGWAMKNDNGTTVSKAIEDSGHPFTVTSQLPPSDRGTSTGVGGGPGFTTPRMFKTMGRTSSLHSECSSTQGTPTKSVTKPLNPGMGGSRPSSSVSNRAANSALCSKQTPMLSFASSTVNTVEVPHFELKEDPSFWMDHNVQVVIRVRPLNSMERGLHGYGRCLKQDNSQCIGWIGQPDSRFTFDHVACETINQETFFRVVGLPMVENCMSGYNSCIFAYGQTGSGKTYTMLGEINELDLSPSSERGMTPRIFEFLFARIKAEEESRRDEKLRYNCKCSFLEIYNEQITDLLDPSSSNLLLREDVNKGIYVENLSEFEVETVSDILKLLIQGSANRKIAATNMNRESSRSHSVFTCVIESRWEKDSTTNLRFARLNLVDLAGSERQKTSGAEGERLKEAASINKSLSTLGHVIMVLVDVARGKQRHVPYRDSRLTFLLQAVVNEDASGDVIALQHQIQLLKEELSVLKRQNVSRSLSFRSAIFHDPIGEQWDVPKTRTLTEGSRGSGTDVHVCEDSKNIRVSTKQLKSVEMLLAGALRREKVADTTIKQLEAEIEQLNRLVRQREEDTQCTKMMLKFREDKIHRMESLVDGLMPSEKYLVDEKSSLAEEIQLLQSRVDRHPEVTRFALENIRLLDQLRRFQDFYEEGERELLLGEVAELRNQLVRLLEERSNADEGKNLAAENQPVQIGSTVSTTEDDALRTELTRTCQELEDCRNRLKCCLESNAKLTMEIGSLQTQLDCLNAVCTTNAEPDDMELCSEFSSMENHVNEKEVEGVNIIPANQSEQIVHLQLELDILKTIFEEERGSRAKLEERGSSEKNKLLMAEERVMEISKHYENAKNELRDARSIIDALESQQLLLITELDELRETHKPNIEVEREHHPEILNAGEKLGPGNEYDEKKTSEPHNLLQPLKRSRNESWEKIKRKQETLKKGSFEEEMDEVCRQAEAETAEVIVCLQDEIASLREEVENSSRNEAFARQCLAELETEMKDVQERFLLVTQDNERFNELIELKDDQVRTLSEEWERVIHDACNDVYSMIDSFPPGAWLGEQVGRIKKAISDRDALIEELQNCVDDAEKVRGEMEWKLRSLRGATLAITEAQQQENSEREREMHQLTSELSEKSSTISRLQNIIQSGEQNMRKSEILASVAFKTVGRISEINSIYLEALEEKEFQVNYSDVMHLLKDAMLQDQFSLNASLVMEIQVLQSQLAEYEDRISILGSVDDLQKTREKLSEFTVGISTLHSFVNPFIELVEEPGKEHTGADHSNSVSGNEIKVERTFCTAARCHDFQGIADGNKVPPCNTIYDPCNWSQEQSGCRITEGGDDRGSTMILFQKELESALHKLKAVQDQIFKLVDEKEETKRSEIRSRKMMEDVVAQLMGMEKHIISKEKELEWALLQLDEKMKTVVEKASQSLCLLNETKPGEEPELDLEVRDADMIATQKAIEASTILSKFEEAQEAMREADIMVNALLVANESARLEAEKCQKVEISLTCERDCLKRKVQELQTSLNMKNEEHASTERRLDSYITDLTESSNLVLALEAAIEEVKNTFGDELKSTIHDVHWFKSQFLLLANLARKCLEDIWSEIIKKDCAVSVLNLCHLGIMLEVITGLNAENGFLHCGMLESNAVMADLREHNVRANKELEMCSILKGKLLADISNSFTCITRKESDTERLKTKLNSLERKLMDVQFQEESMLARSNFMGNELAVLIKEFDTNESRSLEELYSKDLEACIFESVLKQRIEDSELKSARIVNLERERCSLIKIIGRMREEMLLLVINEEIGRRLLLEIEADNGILEREVRVARSQLEVASQESDTILNQLRERDGMIEAMRVTIETLERDFQQAVLLEMDLKDQIGRLQRNLEEKIIEATDSEQSHEIILKELSSKNLEIQILNEKMDAMTSENCTLKEQLAETEDRFSTQLYLLQNEKDRILENLNETNLLSPSRNLSVVSRELDSGYNDQETCSKRGTALNIDDESLINETMHSTQMEEALALISSSQKKCSKGMNSVGRILNELFHTLEGNNFTLMDRMLRDFREHEENVSNLLEKLEFLEASVEETLSENFSLQSELHQKDEIRNDETEDMEAFLQSLRDELASKSDELHEVVCHNQMLAAEISEKVGIVEVLELNLSRERESRKLLAAQNVELKAEMETILSSKDSVLAELEAEVLEARTLLAQKDHFLEKLQNEVLELAEERDRLDSKITTLEEQLDMARALAEENEAISVEAKQIAESKKIYAEEKEEEVRLLERSVEELECTVNMLENNLEIVKGEAEKQRLQREDLEMELEVVRNKMVGLETSSDSLMMAERESASSLRHLDEKLGELLEARKQIEALQKDVSNKESEIVQCKAHIAELNIHADAQARENKQRIKELEAMAQQVKAEASSSHAGSLGSGKQEKTAAKTRGSGSPFKCIGLGLTQQMNSEKDEELTAARSRIEELEAMAARRQKEIFMLNARLAKAESMTHDVIRDLLGVKLDMTNYASLLDEHRSDELTEGTADPREDPQEKDQLTAKLKERLDEFVEERQGWLEEINRKHSEMMAARTALDSLRERERLLSADNEMLKEENGVLRAENEELTSRLSKSEEALSRVKEELSRHRVSRGKTPPTLTSTRSGGCGISSRERERGKEGERELGECRERERESSERQRGRHSTLRYEFNPRRRVRPEAAVALRLAPLAPRLRMASLAPPLSAAAATAAHIHSSSGGTSASLSRHRSPGLWSRRLDGGFSPAITRRRHGPAKSRKTGLLEARAAPMGMAMESLRELWGRCPEPIRSFPWVRASGHLLGIIFDLVLTVAKYLSIPVLAVSSLSEMSYCAHERKMIVIPAPFLCGIAVAKVLQETALKMSPSFKDLEFPWHLVFMAGLFMLLKLPGPYYPTGALGSPPFRKRGPLELHMVRLLLVQKVSASFQNQSDV